MTLDRATVTAASRVMLPAYVILNTLFGLAFVVDPRDRLQRAPSLDVARDWLPITVWGWLWLGLAAVMLAALLIGERSPFVGALGVNVAAWGAWGIVVELAVLTEPNVSLLAGALPAFVGVASFASMLSLLVGER